MLGIFLKMMLVHWFYYWPVKEKRNVIGLDLNGEETENRMAIGLYGNNSSTFQGLSRTRVQLFQGPFPKYLAAMLKHAAT